MFQYLITKGDLKSILSKKSDLSFSVFFMISLQNNNIINNLYIFFCLEIVILCVMKF